MWWCCLLVTVVVGDVFPGAIVGGTYGNASGFPEYTINAKGILTALQQTNSNACRTSTLFCHVSLNVTGSFSIIPWNVIVSDAHGMYNATTGKITVPQAGTYYVAYSYFSLGGNAGLSFIGSSTASSQCLGGQGTNSPNGLSMATCATMIYLPIGATVFVQAQVNPTVISTVTPMSLFHFQAVLVH